jgi:DNA-binding MarR family transcriptional regulator
MCRLLIAERQIVERQLGTTLCANPHWDNLLDIYLAEFEGRSVYQSCLASGAPPAKAHRQSARLAKLGVVERALDPEDHRRMNVSLKDETRAAFDTIMDLLALHCVKE